MKRFEGRKKNNPADCFSWHRFAKLRKRECGGLAWDEFPKLFELIFDSRLPASEYKQKYDLAIEVLHLWTDHDLRHNNRYYEVWISVEPK